MNMKTAVKILMIQSKFEIINNMHYIYSNEIYNTHFPPIFWSHQFLFSYCFETLIHSTPWSCDLEKNAASVFLPEKGLISEKVRERKGQNYGITKKKVFLDGNFHFWSCNLMLSRKW